MNLKCCKSWILGNDFVYKAVIDFNKQVLELDNEIKPVRVSFAWVLDIIRVSGGKVIQKRVGRGDTEARVNVGRGTGRDESKQRIWENRAHNFLKMRVELLGDPNVRS